MTVKYLFLLSAVLFIVLVFLFFSWLRAKDEIVELDVELSKLRYQYKKLKDESIEKSIQEKSSAWRRDRRYGDTRQGGYYVEDERQSNGENEMK